MVFKKLLRWNSSDRRAPRFRTAGVVGSDTQAYNIKGLPLDVLEHVFHFLDARDVVALAGCCKLLRDVASSHRVWADLTQRSFLFEELPQDRAFLSSHNTALIQSQFWKLTRQRPAFLSDAPRTSDVLEHTGSRFMKVLHVDGRRDFNFTTVFRDVPPGQYTVVWRLMLQPGYVRGYCNFRAVFSRPADPKAKPALGSAASHAAAALKNKLLRAAAQPEPTTTTTAGLGTGAAARGALRRPGAWGLASRRGRPSGSPATVAPLDDDLEPVPNPNPDGAQLPLRPAGRGGAPTWRLRRRLRWLASCTRAAGAPVAGGGSSGRGSGGRGGMRFGGSGGAPQRLAPVPGGVGSEALATAPSRSLPASSTLTRNLQPLPPPLDHPGNQPDQQPAPQTYSGALRPQVPEIEPETPLEIPQPPPVPAVNAPLQPQPHHHYQPQPQQPLQRPSRAGAAAAGGGGPQAQLQDAMGRLATASAKRDAALAAAGGPRYVPRWLSPLWGSHACSWRQLDPAGPLGAGVWRSLHMGTLTLRRRADAHLHGVMVQLRPANPEQMERALPAGETRWRGALVDYVELVPVASGKLLGGLLPRFLQRGSLQRGSPVVPEREGDIVEVSRL
ncbi:hypothetical protein PLESTF_001274900 [Pleodorina starrii]|nr:hypothetical protein PLESTM_000461800 [Pleodorina starrii]GLC72653.1 hypothetical protein PLESTF_001274900 [Pleodorina starrii]